MLKPEDLRIARRPAALALRFPGGAEISVEIEPNDMDEARFDALAAIGMTRASLGVQDFDPRVQAAINREQSFELTGVSSRRCARAASRSVNLDLLYGLPHQTCDSVAATVDRRCRCGPTASRCSAMRMCPGSRSTRP